MNEKYNRVTPSLCHDAKKKNLGTVETMNILLIFPSFNCLAVPKYKKETQLQIGNYEYEILLIFSL